MTDTINQAFVAVHTISGVVEKALLADVLTDLEIPFVIEDHLADQLIPIFQPQRGGGRLLVLEQDVGRVKTILAELEEAANLGAWNEE